MPAGGSHCPTSPETIAARLHYVHQDGQAVYKYAVRKMVETSAKLLNKNNIGASDLGCFIPHQANKRIILSTAERLELPLERVIINIDRFGNTTAATIPLAMQTALDEHKLQRGSLALLASVGAGFTVGACLLRWEM
jgi:3-oxoacyl-[acyl-carrier-protein] synthase III